MEGEGGGEPVDKVGMAQEESNVIQGLIDVIEAVGSFADFRRTQRKECSNLVRRMNLLAPMLEEVREFEGQLPPEAEKCLDDLKKVFVLSKKLLITCHEGSKIYLALESEAVMGRFHAVYEKMSQALDCMPYNEIGISDEVREQVELMHEQLKRAKRRADTQDIELAMDMMVVFSKKDDRNADTAILERLAKKLELHTIPELRDETLAVRKLIKERGRQNVETTQQIIDLLNKFKQIAGIDETNKLDDVTWQKCFNKCPSLVIPNDFLCPISLELMTDPVIIATGQTYERSSIQKWLDSNHRTCPNTRQILSHLSLAPNYALRNLILQWCEKNNVELPKKDSCASSDDSEHKEEISTLVANLSSGQLDVQQMAVKKIRLLSKENTDNRIAIASCGAIPPLVHLLSYPDSKIQEHTVTALLNLSIDEGNKRPIAKEGAIPAIIEVLKNGTIEARENSAAALFSLSMLDENKVMVGSLNGIPPLVDLLNNGTIRGKKDAATALFNLSLNNANKARAIEAGIVPPLLQLLGDKQLGMIDEALSILLLLASHPEGRNSLGQLSLIEVLVNFIKDGTPKNKECALSVLLELGLSNSSFILVALQFGVYDHLVDVAKSGTSRARRKASSLLQHMSNCEQVP
ncbi:U-box domain-containing protein 15 [Magnolia sinica]|uniref:U-box domain-containing protein 15 n=1 Tax=Magnolia sinica TaxID=86752 RepID=UPI00265B6BDB|nr:U-box domain-containing protein 15 [Magnolia sinica]